MFKKILRIGSYSSKDKEKDKAKKAAKEAAKEKEKENRQTQNTNQNNNITSNTTTSIQPKDIPQRPIIIPNSKANNETDDAFHKHLKSPPPQNPSVLASSVNSLHGGDLFDEALQQAATSMSYPGTNGGLVGAASTDTVITSNSMNTLPNHSHSKLLGRGGDKPAKAVNIDDVIARLLALRTNGKISSRSSRNCCIKNSEILTICARVREILLEQPVLLHLTPNPSLVIAGDIHGQFEDLLRIFDRTGYPPATNYLFLGDYVDRGKRSLETILLLFSYKIKYLENFFLLRGNHECASINKVYGFFDECKRRTNLKVWKAFTDVFNCLPISSVVASKIFCVHGGLSPELEEYDDVLRIQRPTDVPDTGLLNDLLWSDPSDTAYEWEESERGVSYCFGKRIVKKFLDRNDLDLVCRAHMIVEDGFEFFGNRTLVTIFSAPNYCGEFDNSGAIMSVNKDLLCSFEVIPSSTLIKNDSVVQNSNPTPQIVEPPPSAIDQSITNSNLTSQLTSQLTDFPSQSPINTTSSPSPSSPPPPTTDENNKDADNSNSSNNSHSDESETSHDSENQDIIETQATSDLDYLNVTMEGLTVVDTDQEANKENMNNTNSSNSNNNDNNQEKNGNKGITNNDSLPTNNTTTTATVSPTVAELENNENNI